MSAPIYILAGQSNALTIAEAVRGSLDAKHGAGGYRLVEVHDNGAPLTYARDGVDWRTASELPQQLIDRTAAALQDDPGSRVEGLIWVQGEAETFRFTNPDAYGAALLDLLADIEAGVNRLLGNGQSGLDTADIILSGLSDAAEMAQIQPHWEDISLQQQALAQADPNITLVDPDAVAAAVGTSEADMFRDVWHYSADFSRDLADALVGAVDGAPPPLEFAPSSGPLSVVLDEQGAPLTSTDTVPSGPPYTVTGDLIEAQISFSLRDHDGDIDSLTLLGDADISAIGNANGNLLTGNAGDNILDGAWGDDTLDGGAGADTLLGGRGDDTYIVDDPGDRVLEAANRGTDHVLASTDTALRDHSAHLEHLTLTGSNDLSGTGNGLSNQITGNAGANRLDGAWGDDTLDGGAGADTMTGGQGDDTFLVDRSDDVVIEAVGRGTDHIIASADYALRDHSDHVENLTLTGSADLSGTGNFQNNRITGNEGDNILNGAWGDDTLIGGAGRDTLIGSQGADVFQSATGDGMDRISGFERGSDTISLLDFRMTAPDGTDQRAAFLSAHARIVDDRDLVLDLGSGDGIHVEGLVDPDAGERVEDFADILMV